MKTYTHYFTPGHLCICYTGFSHFSNTAEPYFLWLWLHKQLGQIHISPLPLCHSLTFSVSCCNSLTQQENTCFFLNPKLVLSQPLRKKSDEHESWYKISCRSTWSGTGRGMKGEWGRLLFVAVTFYIGSTHFLKVHTSTKGYCTILLEWWRITIFCKKAAMSVATIPHSRCPPNAEQPFM